MKPELCDGMIHFFTHICAVVLYCELHHGVLVQSGSLGQVLLTC